MATLGTMPGQFAAAVSMFSSKIISPASRLVSFSAPATGFKRKTSRSRGTTFSSALKSFSSNISSNYTIAPQPSSTSGPWKIFDAKRKSTGKAASVFVFDKKSLEPQGGGLGGRRGASSLKRVHEEVVERLKREASSLARLRHPSILELAEPVEETRSGGLMFATEAVTASLASLLHDKDARVK
jgi:SCY1-like protein 2